MRDRTVRNAHSVIIASANECVNNFVRFANRRALFIIRCALRTCRIASVSCVNHACVPYARPLIKLLSVFVVVGRRYFSTASPSFLLLVRRANSRRVQTPSIIGAVRSFSSFSFISFSYRFHIVPPSLFFCFPFAHNLFHAR